MRSAASSAAMRGAPATAPTGSLIQYEGWLNKSDPSGGNWKMRYCVLMPQTFCYYKEGDKKDNSLQGAFELRNARYQHGWSSSRKPPTAYPFGLVLPARTYYFAAASEAERDSWRWHIERTLAVLQGTPFTGVERPPGEPEPEPEVNGYGMPPIAEEGTASTSTPAVGLSPEASNATLPLPPPEAVTFQVIAWGGTPAERSFTLRSRVEKLPSLSVAKIKSNLSRHVGRDAADLNLVIPGVDGHPDLNCEDDWTGDRLGLGGDVSLLLTFKSDEVHALAAAAGVAPPPPPPRPDLNPDRDETAAELRASVGRQLTSADDVEALGPPPPLKRPVTASLDETPAAGVGLPTSTVTHRDGSEDRVTVSRSVEVDPIAIRAGVGRQLTSADDREALGAIHPSRSSVARQMTSTDDALDVTVPPNAPSRSPTVTVRRSVTPTSTLLSSVTGLDDATSQRLAVRFKLRSLFNAVATGGSDVYSATGAPDAPPNATVERTEFAVALGTDEEMMALGEYDPLLRRLLAPQRGAGPDLNWDDISALLRDVQQALDAAAVKSALAAASAAATVAPVAAVAPSRPPTLSTTRKLSTVSDVGGTSTLTMSPIAALPPVAPSTTSTLLPLPRKYAMQLTVDTPSGAALDLNLFAGDDADAVAAQFMALHGLDGLEHGGVLVAAIQRALLDAFAMEMQDALQAKSEALRAQTEAETVAETANGRVAALESDLKRATDEAAANAAASNARIAALEADVQRLTAELAVTASNASAAAAAAQVQVEEATKRRATWDRFVTGGAAVSATASPAVSFSSSVQVGNGSGSAEWRSWAAEKRELLNRANADRSALVEETKRLRAALDGRGVEAEARLRSADEERATLAAEMHALGAARDVCEAELANVYSQWEADGRRWAGEKRRLTEQMDALLAAAAGVGPAPHPVQALGATGSASAGVGWAAEREGILRHWGDETALLTALWQRDKAAWASQRDAVLKSLHVAAGNVTEALGDASATRGGDDAHAAAQRAMLALQAALQVATAPVADSMATIADAMPPSMRANGAVQL